MDYDFENWGIGGFDDELLDALEGTIPSKDGSSLEGDTSKLDALLGSVTIDGGKVRYLPAVKKWTASKAVHSPDKGWEIVDD